MDVDMTLESPIQPIDGDKIFNCALQAAREKLKSDKLRMSQDFQTLLKSAEVRATAMGKLYDEECQRSHVYLDAVSTLGEDPNANVNISIQVVNHGAQDTVSLLLETNRNLEQALRTSQKDVSLRIEEMARDIQTLEAAAEARALALTQEIETKDVELQSLRSALESSRSETCAKDKALSELAVENRELKNVVPAGEITISILRVKLQNAEAQGAASRDNEIQLQRELRKMKTDREEMLQRYRDQRTQLKEEFDKAVEKADKKLQLERERNDVWRDDVVALHQDLIAEIEARRSQPPSPAPLPSTTRLTSNWGSPEATQSSSSWPIWPPYETPTHGATTVRVDASRATRKAAKRSRPTSASVVPGASPSSGPIPSSGSEWAQSVPMDTDRRYAVLDNGQNPGRRCAICVQVGREEQEVKSCRGRSNRMKCPHYGTNVTVGF
ncbi:hypothetical protein FB45DRAFT_1053263 [Roridomyces roridus]|uniref:Uncharacterized protein n=1 Tax=Roridomyces roridus TaxID=1738132 RepID=A0AAD7FYS7_9AGAR|nr:hypothetical protein FB45DRAFT_1053263 [Roridomyces roridus]